MIKHLERAFMLYSEIIKSASLKDFMHMLDNWENTRSGRVMVIVFKNKKQEKLFKKLLQLAFKSWCTGRNHYRVSHYMLDVEAALKELISNQKKVA